MDIGFAIGSIATAGAESPHGERLRAWESSAASSPRPRRLTLGGSNLVYFCEPAFRTQLHMSVCGTSHRSSAHRRREQSEAKQTIPADIGNVEDDQKGDGRVYLVAAASAHQSVRYDLAFR